MISRLIGQLPYALLLGVVLLLVMMFGFERAGLDLAFSLAAFRFLQIVFGVVWLGLLFYLNFVQLEQLPKLAPEMREPVYQNLGPEVLFWFRWSAAAAVGAGLFVADLQERAGPSLMLQEPYREGGLGMWLAILMAVISWAIVWPQQRKSFGQGNVSPMDQARAGALSRVALRTNLMLAIPMLWCLVAQEMLGAAS